MNNYFGNRWMPQQTFRPCNNVLVIRFEPKIFHFLILCWRSDIPQSFRVPFVRPDKILHSISICIYIVNGYGDVGARYVISNPNTYTDNPERRHDMQAHKHFTHIIRLWTHIYSFDTYIVACMVHMIEYIYTYILFSKHFALAFNLLRRNKKAIN